MACSGAQAFYSGSIHLLALAGVYPITARLRRPDGYKSPEALLVPPHRFESIMEKADALGEDRRICFIPNQLVGALRFELRTPCSQSRFTHFG